MQRPSFGREDASATLRALRHPGRTARCIWRRAIQDITAPGPEPPLFPAEMARYISQRLAYSHWCTVTGIDRENMREACAAYKRLIELRPAAEERYLTLLAKRLSDEDTRPAGSAAVDFGAAYRVFTSGILSGFGSSPPAEPDPGRAASWVDDAAQREDAPEFQVLSNAVADSISDASIVRRWRAQHLGEDDPLTQEATTDLRAAAEFSLILDPTKARPLAVRDYPSAGPERQSFFVPD